MSVSVNAMELVPIDSLRPADYNPRRVDDGRLKTVKTSLQKLGWLLPAFCKPDGTILSGHQRTRVARELGYTHVPVWKVDELSPVEERGLNLLFNVSTNDQNFGVSGEEMSEVLTDKVLRAAAECGDWPTDRFPCMEGELVEVKPLADSLDKLQLRYSRNVSLQMINRYGIAMPVVLGPGDQVVNGKGRLWAMAQRRIKQCVAVRIDDERARFADALLNYLSMDFDMATEYADVLRHNSFRRATHKNPRIGVGFVCALRVDPSSFSFDSPKNKRLWIKHYGRSVVDFGAGHHTSTQIIRAAGIRCTPFEPYVLKTARRGEKVDRIDDIDVEASRASARNLLREVAEGRQWSSVVLSSILNSVPFQEDRIAVLTVVAALLSEKSVMHASSRGPQTGVLQNKKRSAVSKVSKSSAMIADFEKDTTVSDIGFMPKVQRYWDQGDFAKLMSEVFSVISGKSYNKQAYCCCSQPHSGLYLGKALEHEFDLPYPDGSRMGLVDEARDAFRARWAKLGNTWSMKL